MMKIVKLLLFSLLMSVTVKHFLGTTRLLSKTNRLPIRLLGNNKFYRYASSLSLSSVNSNDNFQCKLNKFTKKSRAKINIPLPDIAAYRLGTVSEAKQIDYQHIRIISDQATFEIKAFDDSDGGNDSHAHLEVIEGDLDKMIDEEIVSIAESDDSKSDAFIALCPDFSDEDHDCYSNFQVYVFEMKNGERVRILGSHFQNGYYCGGSLMIRENNPNYAAVDSSQARVVLVLGLPASGKTTFCQSHFDEKVFYIFDDPLFSSASEIVLNKLVEKGQKVVFCDPRLCSLDIFKKLYEHLVQFVDSPAQIAVVYFDNDPEQCGKNAHHHRDNIDSDIKRLADRYNDTIAYIESVEFGFRHKQHVFAGEI
jgi:hypothetical protein